MKFVASTLHQEIESIYDVMMVYQVPGYPDYDVLWQSRYLFLEGGQSLRWSGEYQVKVRRCLKISKVLKILVIIVSEPVQLQTQEAGATLGEDRGQTLVTVEHV